MDRTTAAELLPLIQAYANGVDIEILDSDGKWVKNISPNFTRSPDSYRIAKPKPWYRLAKVREGRTSLFTTITVANSEADEDFIYKSGCLVYWLTDRIEYE